MDSCGVKMYEVTKSGARITFTNVEDFNLNHILDCGQCFRWKKERGISDTDASIWYGVVGKDFARITYIPEKPSISELFDDESASDHKELFNNKCTVVIESTNTNEDFWIEYFDLDRDYSAIKAKLSENDPVMREAISAGWGIRILKQDEWETVISFITSQNSNIPRIKGCIETICRKYGEEIGEYKGEKQFSFPDVKTMASATEDELKSCRFGYRAKYIAEAARQINRDGGAVLDVASSMDDIQVIEYLRGISGIGPKVASCIMLFSMAKLNIFPIDVWVKRVMNRLYGIRENDIAKMKEYADEHFGKFGGIAQQYLFYYIRTLADVKPEIYNTLNVAEDDLKYDLDNMSDDDSCDEAEDAIEDYVVLDRSGEVVGGSMLEDNIEEIDEIEDIDESAEVTEPMSEEAIIEDDSPEISDTEEVDILEELMRSNEAEENSEEDVAEESSEAVVKGLGDFKI